MNTNLALKAITLIAGATTAATIACPAAQARRDDPAGTRVITTASSAYPDVPNLAAVAPTGVVYTDTTGSWLLAITGGAPNQIAGAGSQVVATAGKMVWLTGRSGPKTWYDTSSSNTGNVPGGWKAPSPTGGLYEQITPTGQIHVMNQNVTSGRVTDLGGLPTWASVTDVLVPGPTGVLVVGKKKPTTVQMSFLGYADPASIIPSLRGIPAGDAVTCHTATATAVGCVDTTANAVIAISLLGADPTYQTVTQPISAGPAVTALAVAWTARGNGFDVLHSIPIGGGTESVLSNPKIGSGAAITTDGLMVYAPTAGVGGSDAGTISSLLDATGLLNLLRTDPPLPLNVSAMAIGPGAVAWEDDSTLNQPLWSRNQSAEAGTMTLGSQTNVTNGLTYGGIGVSGTRTAYVNPAGNPVVTNGTNRTVMTQVASVVGLTGFHLVYQRLSGYHPMMYDLFNTSNTDLTTYGMSTHVPVVMWGNYLGYAKDDGSIWRADVTGGPAVKVAPAQPSGFSIVYGQVWLYGNMVAWSMVTTNGSTYQVTNQFVDATTSNTPTNVADGSSIVGASAAGVMLITNGVYTMQSWDGASSMTISGTDPVADGNTVAWIGSDGDPRIAPVTYPVLNRPWALGNAGTSTALSSDGDWHFDLPTSAPLTSCSVTISDGGGNTVDTENCDPNAAAQGEAIIDWAPANGLPNARYTWLLNASGDDGSVLAADGTHASITGSVTLGITVSGISPASLPRNSLLRTIIVNGSRFDALALPKFGSGVRVRSVVLSSPRMLLVVVDVASDAPTGVRNVVVSDPGSADALCKACFTVTAT